MALVSASVEVRGTPPGIDPEITVKEVYGEALIPLAKDDPECAAIVLDRR